MNTDRAAGAWIDLQQLQDPMGLYARTYRAKVVAQAEDGQTVDLRPDDPALPDMSKIPIRHGVPGLRVWVELGSYLLVGWDDGRPDRPFAALWSPDTKVRRVSFVADDIRLGSRGASEAFILGTTYRADEDELMAGLQQAFSMLAMASTAGPLAGLQAGMQKALQSIMTFIAKAAAQNGYKSTKIMGER